MIEAGIKQANDNIIVVDTIAAKKPVTHWLLNIPRSPSLSPMTLAFACSQDLEPIAATIAKEAVICAVLASEQGEAWEEDSERLVAFTYSSGVSQVAHMLRLLQLEAIAMEQAAALSPA